MDKSKKIEKNTISIQYKALIAYFAVTAITWSLLSTPMMIGTPIASATTATDSEDSATTTTQTTPAEEPEQPGLTSEEETTITEEPTAPPTTEEPMVPGATTGDITTDTPASQESGPTEPLVGPNATGVSGGTNATGVSGGTNATGATTPQQTVSNIIANIRAAEPDANQTEIAELEEKLPVLVNAISQAGGDGNTTSTDLHIIRTCQYEYDENGHQTKKTCHTVITWD